MQKTRYVGLDVHRVSVSVSTAEDERSGEVRFIGPIPNTPADIEKMAKRLGKDGHRLEFCYEAGPCGYGIYRQLTKLGHGCTVIAPSMVPRKPGSRLTAGTHGNWLAADAPRGPGGARLTWAGKMLVWREISKPAKFTQLLTQFHIFRNANITVAVTYKQLQGT